MAEEKAGEKAGEKPGGAAGGLRVELYKHLKAESSTYIQEIPKIWLQKFFLIGGVVAFILTKQDIPRAGSYVVALGVAAIPVLALLLDAKMLEFGLHSRLISRFVSDAYRQDAAVARWEELFWGVGGPPRDLTLARVRSFTTVVIVVVPTCVVILLSAAVLDRLYATDFHLFTCAGAAVCLAYLAFSVYVWRLVWPAPKGS